MPKNGKRREPVRVIAELRNPSDLKRLKDYAANLSPPQSLAAWVRMVLFREAGL